MSWQKCPVCNGTGEITTRGDNIDTCPTCEGKRIICEATARPPEEPKTFLMDESKIEEIFAKLSDEEEESEEEVMYYATPYYDEIQAVKKMKKEAEKEMADA